MDILIDQHQKEEIQQYLMYIVDSGTRPQTTTTIKQKINGTVISFPKSSPIKRYLFPKISTSVQKLVRRCLSFSWASAWSMGGLLHSMRNLDKIMALAHEIPSSQSNPSGMQFPPLPLGG